MKETANFRTIGLDLKSFAEEIRHYTVGFVKRNSIGQPSSLECVGTGVLVSAGRIYGILTAAHVLEKLPIDGQISLVTFSRAGILQNPNLKMSYTDRISFGEPDWGQIGPDIGFLRLADDVIGTLRATNSFRNLGISADIEPPAGPKSIQFVDAVLGVVDERTYDENWDKPGFKKKIFEANFMDGKSSTIQARRGFDYFSFLPTAEIMSNLPSNFGGISGSGLWRIYFNEQQNKDVYTTEKRLIGICYYQSEIKNGIRSIRGHGSDSIYKLMLKKIKEKWPDVIS